MVTIIAFIIIFINFLNPFFLFFFSSLLFFILFRFFFLLLLIKQLLFSYEMVKVSRLLCSSVRLFVCLFVCLLCLLSVSCRVIIHNLIAFLQFPKGWQFSSFIVILTYICISFRVLLCSFVTPFIMNLLSEILWHLMVSTMSSAAGFFLGGVHWQWHWILQKFGDVQQSAKFLFYFYVMH